VKNSFSKQNIKEAKVKEVEEDICEKNEDRAYSSFLTLDGKMVPGISEKDSISYRIEALRFYLEKQLGEETFIKAYQYLQVKNKLSLFF
jgi:NIMA (never in mitosis gene a)-related kinase